MANISANERLVLSVLDRLLDDNPESSRETPVSRHQRLAELKTAVRRDLENLLNTRVRAVALPESYKELQQSLVNYGIPDITGASLGTQQQQQDFCAVLERVIRRYEPRFEKVKVTPPPTPQPEDRIYRFRIDAVLVADPVREPMVLESELRPGTLEFAVKEVA